MIQLRGYQLKARDEIEAAWSSGARVVMPVLPTGAGKTVLLADLINRADCYGVAIAHRQELVGQMSLALARCGVRHRVIASANMVKYMSYLHTCELGRSFVDPNAARGVCSVDSMPRRYEAERAFFDRCEFFVIDEGHHVLRENKWGRAIKLLPATAKGLLPTATPIRTDGQGLGSHADGFVDTLVMGPTMRELIDAGFLTDYVFKAPPNDIDMKSVNVTSTGEYNQKKLANAVLRSHVMGDVVAHYKQHAMGKLGVTFTPDVETATQIAAAFTASGVPALALSAGTGDQERRESIKRFANGEILQLVNVDLFGEGFDLPAIECASMVRATQSLSLYIQQCGRALRIMKGKDRAIIFDHTGNFYRHGWPDAPRSWSLDRRDKRAKSQATDVEPLTSCPACTGVYEKYMKACPYCGEIPKPAERSKPKQVDGDLVELERPALEQLQQEAYNKNLPPAEYDKWLASRHVPEIGLRSARNKHSKRLDIVRKLQSASSRWLIVHQVHGLTPSEAMKRFYLKFGVDVLTAQTESKQNMENITAMVNNSISEGVKL